MRTTVTLDPDVEALVRESMGANGLSFKAAINGAIRVGLSPPGPRRRFRQPTYAMGLRPDIRYDKALQLAAAVEDQEILHELALGK